MRRWSAWWAATAKAVDSLVEGPGLRLPAAAGRFDRPFPGRQAGREEIPRPASAAYDPAGGRAILQRRLGQGLRGDARERGGFDHDAGHRQLRFLRADQAGL